MLQNKEFNIAPDWIERHALNRQIATVNSILLAYETRFIRDCNEYFWHNKQGNAEQQMKYKRNMDDYVTDSLEWYQRMENLFAIKLRWEGLPSEENPKNAP